MASSNRMRAVLWLALASVGGSLVATCSDTTVPGTVIGGDASASSDGDGGSVFGNSDTAPKLELVSVDSGPTPGKFGYPCDKTADCDSGLCIDSPSGKICSKFCTDDCPKGFACVEQVVPGTSDKQFYCSSKNKYICDPCNETVACNEPGQAGNACMITVLKSGTLGGFCGVKCNPKLSNECPDGYECATYTEYGTGLSSFQCTPANGGDCTCSGHAVDLGLATTCTVKNVNGTCTGIRKCTPTGLSACTANQPTAEICDGVDNDCNGKTDDFTGAAVPCDITNQFGTCKGKVKDCVDGKATCEGAEAKPEACNGIDDNCDGKTDEGLCEDGDPCTNDTCNTDGSCKHIQLGGMACDDGSICTQTDKCVSGKCLGGKEMNCDDKDPCTVDSCNPIDGCQNKAASDAKCTDDGEACTQDICQDGKCVHPQAADGTKCAEDGKPCTADICAAGKCIHPIQDGSECTDDGKPCTNDTCTNGVCTHTPNSGKPCDDGNMCTDSDTCLSGSCKAGKLNLCDDGQPCTKDSCIQGAGCVHDPNGANGQGCAAGSAACPIGVCNGGACVSAPNKTCNYKYSPGFCGGSDLDLPGTCAASGQCTPNKDAITQAGKSKPCTVPCKSICAVCYIGPLPINLCLDILFGP